MSLCYLAHAHVFHGTMGKFCVALVLLGTENNMSGEIVCAQGGRGVPAGITVKKNAGNSEERGR